jgi:hypothetical protein
LFASNWQGVDKKAAAGTVENMIAGEKKVGEANVS